MPDVQKDLLDAYQEVCQAWIDRVRSEVQLWSDLAAKLATSRSFPGGLQAYRDCISHRLQMAAEHGQRLLEDGQKMIAACAEPTCAAYFSKAPASDCARKRIYSTAGCSTSQRALPLWVTAPASAIVRRSGGVHDLSVRDNLTLMRQSCKLAPLR